MSVNKEKMLLNAISKCEKSLKVIYNLLEDSMKNPLKEYRVEQRNRKHTRIVKPYRPYDFYWKKRAKLIRSLLKDAVSSHINSLGIDEGYYKKRYKRGAIERYEEYKEGLFTRDWSYILQAVSDYIYGDLRAECMGEVDLTDKEVENIKSELRKQVNINNLMRDDSFLYGVKDGILASDFYTDIDNFIEHRSYDKNGLLKLLSSMSERCLKD